MFIRYVCNNCGQKCKSAEEYAGAKVNCSRCALPLEIPISASNPSFPLEVHDPSPELLLAAASQAELQREEFEQEPVQTLPENLPEPAQGSSKRPVQQTENKPSEPSTDFNNATSLHAGTGKPTKKKSVKELFLAYTVAFMLAFIPLLIVALFVISYYRAEPNKIADNNANTQNIAFDKLSPENKKMVKAHLQYLKMQVKELYDRRNYDGALIAANQALVFAAKCYGPDHDETMLCRILLQMVYNARKQSGYM